MIAVGESSIAGHSPSLLSMIKMCKTCLQDSHWQNGSKDSVSIIVSQEGSGFYACINRSTRRERGLFVSYIHQSRFLRSCNEMFALFGQFGWGEERQGGECSVNESWLFFCFSCLIVSGKPALFRVHHQRWYPVQKSYRLFRVHHQRWDPV